MRDGVALRLLLQVAGDPGALGPGEQVGSTRGLAVGERAVVEVGRVVQVAGVPLGVHLDVEHPPARSRGARPSGSEARILDGVLEVEEHARARARVALVHQHRAAPQQVAVALEGQVEDGVEQRVAGADEGGQRLALAARSGPSRRRSARSAASTGSPVPISRSRLRTGAGTWVIS